MKDKKFNKLKEEFELHANNLVMLNTFTEHNEKEYYDFYIHYSNMFGYVITMERYLRKIDYQQSKELHNILRKIHMEYNRITDQKYQLWLNASNILR